MKFKDVQKVSVNQPILKTEVVNSLAYIPIDDLPSKYFYYAEGTKIFAKPMSTKNIKSLANTNEDNYNLIFNHVIADNIKGLNIDNLLRSDKFYLIFWLRANTYKESGYMLDFYCPNCKAKSTYNFGVEVLDIDYAKENQNLDITLPNSKDRLKIKYVTVADENRYDEFKRVSAKNIKDFDEDFLSYALEIESVNDENLSLLKRYEYVSNLEPLDYSYLDSFLETITFGVRENVNAKCNKCGGTTACAVTFQKQFFIPHFEFGENK